MIRAIMFFLMNWGYFIAALWVVGGILLFEFLPPALPRKQIAFSCLIVAAVHIWSAYIFHDGMAYQQAIFDKASDAEAARQQAELKKAQDDGAQTVKELEDEQAQRQKVQADYDKLSSDRDDKQCLTPEQLRRITETGKSGAH